MAVTRFELIVHREDGSAVEVVADQRDVAAFERVEKVGFTRAMDEMQMVFFRTIGYFAQRRTGQIDAKVSREAWEAEVIEVELGGEDDADPTNPEASAATS